MTRSTLKSFLLATGSVAILFAGTTAAMADSDPLVQLLKSKGVISAADAQALSAVPESQQRDKLVELLRAKGILSARDVRRVNRAEVAERRRNKGEGATSFAQAPAPQVAQAQEISPLEAAESTPVETAKPPQDPVRIARAPVAHAVTISDNDNDGSYYYASDGQGSEVSPLSFRVGGVSFYPGGDLRATLVFRSVNFSNGTNVLGTGFGVIPFKNTLAGYRSETRITGQGSTFDLRAVTDIGPVHVVGYAEFDLNGNAANNVFVNANSYTPRSRLAYMDATWGNWELSAGQMYSWLTPNRVGLGPDPSTVFLTNNVDDNFNVGLTWTRAAQIRVAYHPDSHWAFGIGIENPDSFTGGEVTFPTAFNAQLANQFNNNAVPSAPAPYPDLTGKIAYDTNLGGDHAIHAEVTGLLTTEAVSVLSPSNTPTSHFQHGYAVGGGVGLNLNFELFRNFHLIGNGYYSDGGGRYIGGLGPNVVVKPILLPGFSPPTFTGPPPFGQLIGAGVAPSLVRAYSLLAGFEYQVCPETVVSAYYGGAYFQRNSFVDITSSALVQPFIGFGGPNSGNNNNRYIQEVTIDATQTFWADPSYGAVQLEGQLSYMERHAWFVAAGAPGYAKSFVGYADLRFLFP
jgi:hypothetical protein